MVVRQFNLFPHLTVPENCVLAPTRMRKLLRAKAEATFMRHLEEVNIPDRPTNTRASCPADSSIARVLCMQPKAMLFDAPTSALDPGMTYGVLDVMIGLSAWA